MPSLLLSELQPAQTAALKPIFKVFNGNALHLLHTGWDSNAYDLLRAQVDDSEDALEEIANTYAIFATACGNSGEQSLHLLNLAQNNVLTAQLSADRYWQARRADEVGDDVSVILKMAPLTCFTCGQLHKLGLA